MGNNNKANHAVCPLFRCRNTQKAFTLLEMLTAIAVLAILSTLTLAAVGKAKAHAESARSVMAAKTMINAFNLHAAENGGRLFPGYSLVESGDEYHFREQKIINVEAIRRYPFRLVPYLNDDFNGSMWVGSNHEQLSSISNHQDSLHYNISMFPAFGINYEMVGGYLLANGSQHRGTRLEAVTTQGEMDRNLIVFASAGKRGSDHGASKYETINGFHRIAPPNSTMNGTWSGMKWKKGANPAEYGNLDARANGNVVVAFSDGSVRTMGVEDLRDMRLWSRNAAIQNDRFYIPSVAPR